MALVRLIAALLLLWPSMAMAQVQQSGTVTPGHPTMWTTNGVVQDAGTSSQGKLTTLGITSSNLQSQCINNGPATGPYNSLCFGINGAQAQITLSNFGGAPPIPLQCVVNGVTSNCLTLVGSFLPLSGGTLSGPLILSGDPTLSLGAATKHYVDASLPVGGPFLPLVGGKLTGQLSLTGPNGTTSNPGLQIYPPLHADGVTSDDAILQAAIASCTAQQGTVFLPPGKILLTGAAGPILLNSCALVGAGVMTSGTVGTEIDLTSTTVAPFTVGHSWSVSGVNFYWPNQTGAVVYPPLFPDDPARGAGDFYLNNVNIINAYDGIVQNAHAGWGRFYIVGGNYYAVHDLMRLNNIGDSSHITTIHMTPGPWLERCGNTCQAAIDTGANNNTLLHVTNGGGGEVAITWNNSAAFDWRYGILIDSGGLVGQSDFSIDWDTVATIIDASSGGEYAYQNTFRGSGEGTCGATYSYVAHGNTSYHTCFNLGNHSYLLLEGGTWWSSADLIDISGGALYWSDAGASPGPSANGGGNTYLVNATAAAQLYFTNMIAVGHVGDAGVHGIVSTAATPSRLTLTNSQFGYFNDILDTKISPSTIITSNFSYGTTGANSIIFTDSAFAVAYADNKFDKPTSPVVPQVITNGQVVGNLTMNNPTGFVDFSNGSTQAPTKGTTSGGTRLRFFNQSSPPDYTMGIETGNFWFAVPNFSTIGQVAQGGWKFYGGSVNALTLDSSGSVFASGTVHANNSLQTGSANLSTAGAITTLDVPGSVVSAAVVNAGGTGYFGADTLSDGFGGLYTGTVVSGGFTTLVRREIGAVNGTPPCTTNCPLYGGQGSGATADLTWTAGTTINIGSTAATAVNIGNSGSTTTLVGALKLATSSTGASTQTFTNSPCSGLTSEQWVPVQITGQTGTWYVPACQ